MTFTNENMLNNRKQKPYTAHLHTIKRLGIIYFISNNENHIKKMIFYIQYIKAIDSVEPLSMLYLISFPRIQFTFVYSNNIISYC